MTSTDSRSQPTRAARGAHLPALSAAFRRPLSMLCLAAPMALAAAYTAPAFAQTAAPATTTAPAQSAAAPEATTAAPARARAPQVGEATRALLAAQASGASASPTPRPIAGDVAQRSYDRYLKSFEHPIPESFTSTVKAGQSAGR